MRRITATLAARTRCADQIPPGNRAAATGENFSAQPAELAIVRRTKSDPTNTRSLIKAHGPSGRFLCTTNDDDITTFWLKNGAARHHLEA